MAEPNGNFSMNFTVLNNPYYNREMKFKDYADNHS